MPEERKRARTIFEYMDHYRALQEVQDYDDHKEPQDFYDEPQSPDFS